MKLLEDFLLEYVGLLGRPAKARIVVYDRAEGSKAIMNEKAKIVVVYAQPSSDYEGLSVTNGAERIATRLLHLKSKTVEFKPETTEYVEYYPPDQDTESFSVVEFRWTEMARTSWNPKQLTATDPGWAPATREDIEQLIGGEFILR